MRNWWNNWRTKWGYTAEGKGFHTNSISCYPRHLKYRITRNICRIFHSQTLLEEKLDEDNYDNEIIKEHKKMQKERELQRWGKLEIQSTCLLPCHSRNVTAVCKRQNESPCSIVQICIYLSRNLNQIIAHFCVLSRGRGSLDIYYSDLF
jgi:hypothetical protein